MRVDAAGDLYISDLASNMIRKVNATTGVISTIAGNATAGYTGDGGDASKAQLNAPADFALDESGNLYVADSQNAALRKIDVADAPSLSFAVTNMGSISASQDVSVMNLGNGPLNISQVSKAANYSLAGADTSCRLSGGETLNGGESCTLGIEFTPTTAGSVAGSVVHLDNATPPSQTLALSGIAVSMTAAYTLTAKTPVVSITAGTNGTATLLLNSTNYAGTVSFATKVTSADGTPADSTATATAVTLTPGASATSTVTISANESASNRAPWTPSSGGATVFCAFLVGLPFVFRRKRSAALLLCALTIPLAGLLIACSGATDPPKAPSSHTARTYIVTATPAASADGSMTITNPAPAAITVTVH